MTQTTVTARKQATNRQQANTRGRIDARVAERTAGVDTAWASLSTAIPYCTGRQIFSLKLCRKNAKKLCVEESNGRWHRVTRMIKNFTSMLSTEFWSAAIWKFHFLLILKTTVGAFVAVKMQPARPAAWLKLTACRVLNCPPWRGYLHVYL